MDPATLSCCILNPSEPNLPPKTFTFDGVYGTDSTTEAIYNDNGFSLVEVRNIRWKNKNLCSFCLLFFLFYPEILRLPFHVF
jgi:hypothetical protein